MLGVGAVVLAVPPVASVPYHCKLFVPVAVAVKATAVAFWQYVNGLTVGAVGVAVTVTSKLDRGLSQSAVVF